MDAPTGERHFTVPPELDGERLDRALVALTENSVSRTRLQGLIRADGVAVDGQLVRRPNTLLEAGSELVLDLPSGETARSVEGRPVVDLDVLYEDEHVAVIDKPAGLLVHPKDKVRGGTVADLAVERFGALPEVQGAERPGIVHRLDRLTSGVMLLGRTTAALEALKAQFQARTVEKTYAALCHGVPRFDSDWIEAEIGASPRHPDRKRVVPDGEGRPSTTFVETRESFPGFCYVAAHPKTGRRHQIRVHLLHVGLPIVGDRVYRHPGALPVPVPDDAPKLERQALHAERIAFDHPATGERVAFEAPLPADMARFLEWLRAR